MNPSTSNPYNDAPPSYKDVMRSPSPDTHMPLPRSKPEVIPTVNSPYPDTRTSLIHSHLGTIPTVLNPYPNYRESSLHPHPEIRPTTSAHPQEQISVQVSKKSATVDNSSYSETTMLCIRLGIVIGIVVGICLCLWEVSFRNSLRSSATWQEKKEVGLRAAFGGIILGFAVLCYFADAFTNATYKTINGVTSDGLEEYLTKIRRGRPKITWYMECFHRDIYSTVVTNPDGSMRTEQRNEQITTWNGLQGFQYSTWTDASKPMENGDAITRITFQKKFALANGESMASFEDQKQAFIAANRQRDREFTITEIFDTDGFRDEIVVASSSSFITNVCVYMIMVLTFLLYPWLCIINACETHVTYTHTVKVSV